MVYGDLQFFDIIIFAAIAVFIIYRLRSVLGKRTGFQKKPVEQQFVKKQPTQEKKEIKIPQLRENEQKLENVYKKIPSFEHKAFLEGAKKAFEIIITAFNKGDTPTLKNLVSKLLPVLLPGPLNPFFLMITSSPPVSMSPRPFPIPILPSPARLPM